MIIYKKQYLAVRMSIFIRLTSVFFYIIIIIGFIADCIFEIIRGKR